MKRSETGVTAAKGFRAAGVCAGIKKNQEKDMALIVSDTPCRAAGVFTTNVVKAAPVKWDQEVVRHAGAQAVVINSGVANACTGESGRAFCEETAQAAATVLSLAPEQVLVASTGVIGEPLPMDAVRAGISALAPLLDGGREAAAAAAEAILTTDTVKKETAVSFELRGKTVTVGGMCKGSGMIHPNLCTMLCFVTTDAAISQTMLQKALREDVADTFNMISVDGDTSTNDTVLLLANGEAGNPEITEEGEDYQRFAKALREVNTVLAKKIAGDGEGATALLEVKIVGACDREQARKLARSVVSSSLTKAAVCGHDANWGRVLCAMGYAGVPFDPERVDLWFESAAGKIAILRDGTATGYSEETATQILSKEAVTVTADLKEGNASATAWGCDLTCDYVRINADYRS